MAKKWMQAAAEDIKSRGTKGALRKQLGVKNGEKIPLAKLEKAKHSSNPLERKRATLAETFRKASHKK